MKNRKLMLLTVITILILSACGQNQNNAGETFTLRDQNNNEITFPQNKPALFFFITTYT